MHERCPALRVNGVLWQLLHGIVECIRDSLYTKRLILKTNLIYPSSNSWPVGICHFPERQPLYLRRIK
jgi:hypothetical protein